MELHPDWALYLQENLAVVRGWAAWSWCQFLSAKNPNVPAVSEKLFPPAQRASVAPQDGFWRRVLEQRALRCIYSGEPLEARAYSLDHFLPWSFVLHDQLWNLVPVSRSANSAKSDRLPSLEYLQPFVQVQCQGLIITRKTADKRTWQRVSEPYLSGLRVSPATLDSASATGLGVGLLVFLYWLTRSRDFEQGMLALSSEQSDNATMVMVAGLALSVVLLAVGRWLGQGEPKA